MTMTQNNLGRPMSGLSDIDFHTTSNARVPHPSQSHREGWEVNSRPSITLQSCCCCA